MITMTVVSIQMESKNFKLTNSFMVFDLFQLEVLVNSTKFHMSLLVTSAKAMNAQNHAKINSVSKNFVN